MVRIRISNTPLLQHSITPHPTISWRSILRMGNGVLTSLAEGAPVPYGGDRIAYVSRDLAASFRLGDRLLVIQETGDLLRVPAEEHAIAAEAVDRAMAAFEAMRSVPDA